MKNTIIVIAGLLIGLFAVPVCASAADKQQFCKNYATTAVDQYHKAKKLFNPQSPAWSDDWKGHYKWCMFVPESASQNEQDKRQAEISEHLGAASQSQSSNSQIAIGSLSTATTNIPAIESFLTVQRCENYAKESVRQNKQNISMGCGLKSSSWSNDFDAHSKWCLHGNNYKKVDKNLDDRNKQLLVCTKQYSSSQTKIRGRSSFGTSMATTYMDMRNMFVPHENNCDETEAFVPLWDGGKMGFCMEKKVRGSAVWAEAVRICLSENKRLPEPWEWKVACNRASSLGIDEMAVSTVDVYDDDEHMEYGYKLSVTPRQWGSNFAVTPFYTPGSMPDMVRPTLVAVDGLTKGLVVPIFGGEAINSNSCDSGSYLWIGASVTERKIGRDVLEERFESRSAGVRCVH